MVPGPPQLAALLFHEIIEQEKIIPRSEQYYTDPSENFCFS